MFFPRVAFPLFIILLLFTKVNGQAVGDYRSIASGPWSTIGNWETYNGSAWVAAAAAPSSANGVITIQSPHTIQITANVTVDQVVINSGATLNWTAGTFTIANGTGVDLQVDGTVWDNRGATTPSVAFNTSASWQLGASGTIIRSAGNSAANWQGFYQGGISTIPSTSNWILRKTSGQNPSITTTAAYYGNLTIENNVAGIWTTSAGSTFNGANFATIKGNFDIGGSGTSTVDFLNNALSATTATQVNGNLVVRSGNILRNYGTGVEVQGDVTVNGTVNYSGGTGNRKLIFSGGNAQSVSGTGTMNVYDITVNKSSNALTLNRAITIDNVLTLTSGIIYSSAANLPTLNTAASVTGTSNASFVSGPIRYIGSNALIFPVGKGSDYQPLGISACPVAGGAFYTETFENSCSSACLASTYGGWTIDNSGGCNDTYSNKWFISCAENGNAAGACGSACGSNETIHIGADDGFYYDPGAAYDAGGFGGCGSGGTTTYTRAVSPLISTVGKTGITFSMVYIEGGETTNDDGWIEYSTDGGTTWALLVNPAKTATGCCSFFGCQGIWTNLSLTLPVAAENIPNFRIRLVWKNNDDGAGSDPSFAINDITLSTPAAVSDFTCEYFYADPQIPYGNVLAPTLAQIENCEYWILTRNAGTENKYVTLNWDGNSCLIGTPADQRVARYDGISTWQDEGNSATTGTMAAGSVTSNLVTSFSPFTIGDIPVVLPIELLTFEAKPVDNTNALLTWRTATEINNDKFDIERSRDGANFEYIGSVKGAGKSSSQKSYSYTDLFPYEGITYYRLKQVDYDGAFTYTPIRPVTIAGAGQVHIFPNPNNGNEVFVSLDEATNGIGIYVTDISGQLVQSQVYTVNSAEKRFRLAFNHSLAPGVYFVNVNTGQKTISCRLVVSH